jgi:protocatechuate 3,4-dioxygenase alpha subunit
MADVTPYQPVGPYFHVMLDHLGRVSRLAGDGARGERIAIEGVLRDGAGRPLADGMIEVWQADADGRYRHPEDSASASADPHFWGYGRVDTDDSGRYRLETVKPGRVAGPSGSTQAPHILVSVYAPGILTRFTTRLYFEGDPANDTDPVLTLVPAHRRQTLIATRNGEAYRFDIVLQGEGETVFFEL